jgi:Flp pilus assembly pilin Flp
MVHDGHQVPAFLVRRKDTAMTPSPSPVRFPARHNPAQQRTHKAAELESMAQIVEHLIPKFKNEDERQFYREIVQSYRTTARDILRRAWSDDQGQDIAEYAVMLAVILLIVVGTIRLIGSNANTIFSETASAIQ